jgi:hypothetical protein
MYVQRDAQGKVIGCFAVRQPGVAEELLPNTSPDILAFLAPATQDQRAAAAVDNTDRLQFEVLFDHENRTRVLEIKPQITRAQFRDALINRWKQLNT